MAIFPPVHQSLPPKTKQQIFQQYRLGDSAETLALRFCRSCTRICRIIQEMRAARIMDLPWTTSATSSSPVYARRRRNGRSCSRRRKAISRRRSHDCPAACPRIWPASTTCPCSTREQEAHLFRKMNYLKYQASGLRDTLDVGRPKSRLMDQIERLYDEAVAIKKQVISANLRLVISIAKRYVGQAADFFELVSDGNLSLMRAAERFDVSRGNRFSTYASWAIMRNFAIDPCRAPSAGPFFQQPTEGVRHLPGRPRGPVPAGVGSNPTGVARGTDPAATRRSGAADRHPSFWSDSRSGTADFEAGRNHAGRKQRADPADRVQGDGQIENGCRGGPNRVIYALQCNGPDEGRVETATSAKNLLPVELTIRDHYGRRDAVRLS